MSEATSQTRRAQGVLLEKAPALQSSGSETPVAPVSASQFDAEPSTGVEQRVERGVARRTEVSACHETCNPAQHITLHRSWRSVAPSLLLYLLSLWVMLVVSPQHDWSVLRFELPLFGVRLFVSMPLLGLFSAVLLARPLVLLYDCYHQLRCHHIVSISGLCSTKIRSLKFTYDDLLGVEASATLLQRILGTGTLIIGTAVRADQQLILPGIAHPEKVAQLISERIDAARMARLERLSHHDYILHRP